MYLFNDVGYHLILYQVTGQGQQNFANIVSHLISVVGISLRFTKVFVVVT